MEKIKNYIMTALFLLIIIGFTVANFAAPDADVSVAERRKLATVPKPDYGKIMSGEYFTEFDGYMLDQFVLRDGFRRVKAISEYYLLGKGDNNQIYLSDGCVSKTEYPENPGAVQATADKFSEIKQKLFGDDVNAYYTVIPDKNYFLAEKSGHLSIDYDGFISELNERVDKSIGYIDITDLLTVDDYYSTDIHWRQEKIMDVADRLLAGMGAGNTPRDYSEQTLEPFYGGYFGQAALPVAADRLVYLTDNITDGCTVTEPVTGECHNVYRTELFGGMDSYDVFLGGAKPLLVISNPQNTGGKKLYIVRDSFASSVTPLLLGSYSEIILIDIRYISPDTVQRFITPEKGADLLFMLNTVIINRSMLFK